MRLEGPVFLRCIEPPEPIAVDEDDTAQNTPIVNAMTAASLSLSP